MEQEQATSVKHQRGDRKDGYLVRESDAMHAFMPYILPDRADNEAVLNEIIQLTAVDQYLQQKNSDNPEFKYTFFHVICAALAKTFVLRPKMNRFYAGSRLYDRKEISFSFVVKKKFTDNSEEALAIITIDRDSKTAPIQQIYEKVKKIVYSVRKQNNTDGTTDKIGVFLKFPQPIIKIAIGVLKWLDYHGKYPQSLMKDDPYYTSIFISNLGSIKMNANYHHLTNWGTNSVFVIIGERKPMPFFEADGSYIMKDALELGITIDERIADGLYFANSIKMFRQLIADPQLLDLPINTPINIQSGVNR